MTRYGMVIDTKKCVGCHVCAMACKTENNLPNDVWWNRIFTDNGGEMGFDMVGGSYPDNLQFGYVPVACQHCENPACVKVCPVGATYKDPETGVVRQDYDKCIGCRMCMSCLPLQRRALLQLGGARIPHGLRHGQQGCARASAARRGEVHLLLPPHLPGHRAGLHAPVRGPRPILGRPETTRTSEVSRLIADTLAQAACLEERGTEPSTYYLV